METFINIYLMSVSMTLDKCNGCNVNVLNIKGNTKFKCPNCGKYEIIRCNDCRKRGTKYKCPKCGFEGPN